MSTKTKGIYTSCNIKHDNNAGNVQRVRYNREQLISNAIAEELNTYNNFGIFPTFADTYTDYFTVKNETGGDGAKYKTVGAYAAPDPTKKDSYAGTPGVRSIFNRAGAIIIGREGRSDGQDDSKVYDIDIPGISRKDDVHGWRIGANVPLMDSPSTRQRIRKNLGCSVRELVEASQAGKMGQETYNYSDFMYCKHLGKMPNNYMITLRRFPYPVDDYIGTSFEMTDERRSSYASKNPTCIGCMVTWMGVSGNNLNEILKYSYKLPFKEQQAELQDSKSEADQNTSVLSGIFNAFDKTYQQEYMLGRAGESANAAFSHFGINLGNPPYTDHRGFKDRNKVYGPVDAIKSTYIRSDEGIVFNQKITLTFEYELKAYNGINPRQAMLDLISNILNVTYTTGSFWGGGIKAYGAQQSNIFANLNVMKTKGGFSNYVDAFAKDLSTLGTKVKKSLGIEEGKEISIKNVWQQIKGVLNTVGGMLIGGMLNKMGRPQKAMYNSLLSPAPIGFWHVTIGNPKAPIMSIGNMVITNCTIEHNGPLGLDNFPTGLKVTIDLDRGKPRDLRDIERLYMNGNDRIYSSMTDKVFNMYRHADHYKNWKRNGGVLNYAGSTKVFDDALLAIGQFETATSRDAGFTVKDGNTEKSTNATVTTYRISENYVKNIEAIAKSCGNLIKYFGTTDAFSIYIAATEQEYGSTKPTGTASDNITTDKVLVQPATAPAASGK